MAAYGLKNARDLVLLHMMKISLTTSSFSYSMIAVTPEKFIRTGNFISLIWITLMKYNA